MVSQRKTATGIGKMQIKKINQIRFQYAYHAFCRAGHQEFSLANDTAGLRKLQDVTKSSVLCLCYNTVYIVPISNGYKCSKKTSFLIKGVATGGGPGELWPPTSIFVPERSNSFSFKQRYCFLWVLRNYIGHKFHDFHRLCYNFWLNTQGKQITSRWTF